ncbi:MAG: cytochrome C oxidase subunit IV family protein [Deltaproteobacteria bacterium]|nr:cytochrome C oxidase subunit IV family protein [Deltaproteobacteria bacterium]
MSTKAQESHHEDHGIGRYVAVFAVLLVLTGVTVWTGEMNFGNWNIIIAMAIAIVKASLVVLFFMHLWDEGPVNRLIFVVSVIFVGVLILFTFGDLMFRIPGLLPNFIQADDVPKVMHAPHGGH